MPLKLLLVGAALLAAGCDSGGLTQPQPLPTSPPSVQSDTSSPSPAAPPDADNTAVNERDRAPDAKTPIDQNENTTDIKITADIRKAVVKQPDFSIDAQNVKIITADGKVTLRGPVKTQQERDTIEKIARGIAGKDQVDNQIEVTP